MRPAVSGLTAGVLSGGLGQGVQLFKEPMDLPFVESGVPLQLSFRRLHLLPVFAMSGIFIAVLSRLWLVSHGVAEQSLFIFVLTRQVGDLKSGAHLSKCLP